MELETPIASTDGQCCGAGVWEGGAEINCDLELEPKLSLLRHTGISYITTFKEQF